ncbi:MAG: flagellar hook-associated protein 3, partial [Nitrospirae bacterium]
MRISTFQIYDNIIRSIRDNMGRLSLEGERLSSGKKLNRPSDDPVGAGKSISYRLSIGEYEQYRRNQNEASSYLEATDTALEGLTDALTRVRELSLSALNDTLSEQDREAIAKEVSQLKSHTLGLANTRYRDRYIFSGMLYDRAAFDSSGAYQGDENYIETMISPDLKVRENIIGTDAFAFQLDEHEVIELDDGRYIHYIPGKVIDPSNPETRVYVAISSSDDKGLVETAIKSSWPPSNPPVEDALYFDST